MGERTMEKTTTKPAAKAPAKTGASAKATPAAPKGATLKEIKTAADVTKKACASLTKKLINHKCASWNEITDLGGVNKDEMTKIIETLDGMGAATYETVCALRDLHNKMK